MRQHAASRLSGLLREQPRCSRLRHGHGDGGRRLHTDTARGRRLHLHSPGAHSRRRGQERQRVDHFGGGDR